ncbi:MAG TPA: class I SAM-dependent methyltransferase [Puia sp.]
MDYSRKSGTEEIRKRFDQDVERFSNLETGQQTVIDSPMLLDLTTGAAFFVNPQARNLLDIGCGAGNYTLKMLEKIPGLNCVLVDLSMPMLVRAEERVSKATPGRVDILQADILKADLPEHHFDIVLAASVLHHLRGTEEWINVFNKIFNSLNPGGSFWISDLITQDTEPLNRLFSAQYARHLESLGGEAYRKKVLDYVEREDSPRSLNFQLDLMKQVGFRHTEILHKNGSFAAFGGIK